MSNGNYNIIHLIAGLIKSEPYDPFGGDINVKVDLSNYATKTDLKNVSHVDVSSFVSKTNLARLKTQADEIDVDLAKLSNVVENDVDKKTEYNTLVAKVYDINTTNFILRTKYKKMDQILKIKSVR